MVDLADLVVMVVMDMGGDLLLHVLNPVYLPPIPPILRPGPPTAQVLPP